MRSSGTNQCPVFSCSLTLAESRNVAALSLAWGKEGRGRAGIAVRRTASGFFRGCFTSLEARTWLLSNCRLWPNRCLNQNKELFFPERNDRQQQRPCCKPQPSALRPVLWPRRGAAAPARKSARARGGSGGKMLAAQTAGAFFSQPPPLHS